MTTNKYTPVIDALNTAVSNIRSIYNDEEGTTRELDEVQQRHLNHELAKLSPLVLKLNSEERLVLLSIVASHADALVLNDLHDMASISLNVAMNLIFPVNSKSAMRIGRAMREAWNAQADTDANTTTVELDHQERKP